MSKPTDSPDGASLETNDSDDDSNGKPNHSIHCLHVFNANWQPHVMQNTTSESHLLHVNLRCFLLFFTSSLDYSDLWCEKQQKGKNIKPPKKNQTLAKQYKISKYLYSSFTVRCLSMEKLIILTKATNVRHDGTEAVIIFVFF